jgi:hypothetical protein
VNRAEDERRIVADLWLGNAGLDGGQRDRLLNTELTAEPAFWTERKSAFTAALRILRLPPETAHIFNWNYNRPSGGSRKACNEKGGKMKRNQQSCFQLTSICLASDFSYAFLGMVMVSTPSV